ncbi:hypothetical protein QR680_011951 [Steinernema hermaphroditum]|uniref:G-protein coupled receptors family 1 profile domain-containing protein n=1 Tax=Steinernema hermaphroditum TaxID=289476 RepID=A0AA39LZN3_9BILA|nr:hypothetical protein QR680_011951 [Steinernema hermaphroditum]
MNTTAPEVVYVLQSYLNSAITVTVTIIPSLLPNGFILFVGVKSNVIKDKFKDSIITMTSLNIFTAITVLTFNAFYFIYNFTRTPVNFYVCSAFRRFTAYAYSPMFYGCIIVAADRFYGVVLSKPFNRMKIFILNVILSAFPFALFINQISSTNWRYQDICGPTLSGHFTWMLDVNTALFMAYPLVAFVLNGYILYYIYHNAKGVVVAGRKLNTTEEKRERHVLYGMLIQSFLPALCHIPMMVCVMLLYKGLSPPGSLLIIANIVTHANLTLNPIFTVLFVKQFREATRKLISSSKVVTF